MSPWTLLLLAGCDCNGKDLAGSTDTNILPTEASFASIVANDIPGGNLLAAWSDGDDLMFVGGETGSGLGQILWYMDDHLCVDQDLDLAERALWWVHGKEPGDWYAVGEGGLVLHNSPAGRERIDIPSPDLTLFGVFDDATWVWAVGGQVFADQTGEVWRRPSDGSADWELFYKSDAGQFIFKVWEDWIVGAGVAWRIDGDMLVEMPVPNGERLLTMRGRSTEEAWAVGGLSSAQMLSYADGGWATVSTEPICGSGPLMGVWTAPGEDVWISGSVGTAARFDGTAWHCAGFPIVTDRDFHAVWKHEDQVFFVGGNLASTAALVGTIAMAGAHETLEVRACE
jgi:hypothetical protein